MQFRTIVNIDDYPYKLSYKSKSLFIGSCFTNNIGNILKNLHFNCIVNPFGVLFNPISVCDSIDTIIDCKMIREEDLFVSNDLYHSFKFHSSFSKRTKEDTILAMNDSIIQAHKMITHSDFIFITLGTAYVYELDTTKQVVANCHKLPANTFNRRKITESEIINKLNNIYVRLQAINPNINIIYSISPIRHLSDGAHENQLSKAVLLSAVDQVLNTNCFYFPAYEILMDELRDYRFYADDMCHPSNLAIEYIWKRFEENLIEDRSKQLIPEAKKIFHAKQHRSINPESKQYKEFLNDLHRKEIVFLEKISKL